MNAHLACLYTARKRIDNMSGAPMAVGPPDLIRVQDDGGMSLSGNPHLGELLRAGQEGRAGDWRLARSELVSKEAMEESLSLLGAMLTNAGSEALPLAALALRAAAAHHDHNFDSSLIQSWALAEKLLTTIWERYLDESRDRDFGEEDGPFISAKRRETLTGRDFTISVVCEVLSLLDRLPFGLYRRQGAVRRARNKWMHQLEPVEVAESAQSLFLALDLLRLVWGIDLDPLPAIMLVSGV